MGRRRGGTTGTLLIGALVLTAILFGEGRRTNPSSVMKAEVSQSDGSLQVGGRAFAADGTEVSSVSGLSRATDGRIERIRVSTFSPLGIGQRNVIIRPSAFRVEGTAVRLTLSVAQVDALPTAMVTDGAAGFMGGF
jgi:hypothetical protein